MKNTSYHEKLQQKMNELYITESGMPLRYVFVLTNQCNLRCPFCFQHKKKQINVTAKEWIDFADQLPEYARVTLTGGEPLLYEGFNEVFTKISSTWDCNIITNGLLLHRENLELILTRKKCKVLAISIDSIGNDVRGMDEMKWEKLISNIKLFHTIRKELRSEIILDIKCTVLDDNSSGLYELYEYAFEELQCDTFAFQFLKGSDSQHSDTPVTIEELEVNNNQMYEKWDKIVSELKQVQASVIEKGRSVFMHPSFETFTDGGDLQRLNILQDDFNADNFSACKLPWSSVHINSNGDLSPCISYVWGNITNSSLQDIIQSEKADLFKKIIRERSVVPACRNCGWLKCGDNA